MAINFRRYIDITSGVGAGVRVPGRELIGRIFTRNDLAPADTFLDFEYAADVGAYFDTESEEYRRASFYFGFISKTQVRPRKLTFVRWSPDPTPATLRGAYAAPALADFRKVENGAITLSLNQTPITVGGLDFSGVAAYADVAAILEEAVRNADSRALWAQSTISYNSAGKTFVFTAGEAGETTIEPAGDASEHGLADLLRWSEASGPILSNGYGGQSVADALDASTDVSNNFGSFLFMGELSVDQMQEAANFAHLSNVQFMYCQRVSVENAAGVSGALAGYDGVALTEYDPAGPEEYPEMVPMILLAATDYTRLNGTLNYMFHQFNLTPTVTDNRKADQLDELRVNYYGRTQQAGQLIDFYQRGVLLGSIQDMNIYANEMWLKDRAGADIMTLKLNLPKISANARGKSQVVGCLQNVIQMALKNGTISIEKDLNYTQRAFIQEITGDDKAWAQIQSQGWWLNVEIQEYTTDDRVEYKVVYLLVYSKDDIIRKTEGTHSLI